MRYFRSTLRWSTESLPRRKRVEMKLTWRGKAANRSPTPGRLLFLRTPSAAFSPKILPQLDARNTNAAH